MMMLEVHLKLKNLKKIQNLRFNEAIYFLIPTQYCKLTKISFHNMNVLKYDKVDTGQKYRIKLYCIYDCSKIICLFHMKCKYILINLQKVKK